MPQIVDEEEHFWREPLGAWIKDCISGCDALIPESAWRAEEHYETVIRFTELCDGLVFNLLFVFVDSDSLNLIMVRDRNVTINDVATRLKQFSTLIHNIYNFYRNRLHKLIVMPLPDVLMILRNPHPDGCSTEINKLLLLLLGCAVQGDQREKFIERIKCMQTDLQTAIVQQIQRVTEDGEFILNIDDLEVDRGNEQSVSMLAHLERVIKERDTYANCLLEMAHEHESDESSTTTGASSLSGEIPTRTKLSDIRYDGRTPSPTSMERHVNVELASAKAELRKLRNLTEEKDELVVELRDELDAREADLRKMQQERLELIKDARAAKDYRDELDCLQHKLTKLERLETENVKLREKLSEMEFLKSRLSQLKEENDLVHESCTVLEQQLEQSQRKASTHLDTETKLSDCQDQLQTLKSDLTKERERIEQLLLENGRLERELSGEQQKSAALERQVESISEEQRSAREDFGSLGSQMADDDKKRILELQLENRKLKSKLQSTEETEEVGELRAKLLRAEIELSQRTEESAIYCRQIQEFQLTLSQMTAQYKEACEMYEIVKSERDSAQQSLHEARKNFSEFQADFQKEVKSDFDKKARELEASAVAKDRQLQSAIEEKSDLEKQIEKFRNEREELRQENSELIDELKKVQQSITQSEKTRKSLEVDRNTFKERNELLEQRLDQLKVKQLNVENIERRFELNEQLLTEKQNRLNELNAEQRQITQQLDVEMKKVERLNEELISVKSRYGDLISRLRSLCSSIQLNGGQCEVPSKDEDMVVVIDDLILKALTTAKREADTLRIQQHAQIAELTDLRNDIEKLRKSEGHISSEVDDRLRELSIENRNVKEQVFLLQERIREIQLDNSSKTAEVLSLKREIEETQRGMTSNSKLHTELAKLQVSLKNLQLQEELLRRDNSELQKQLEICENQKLAVKSDLDTMQSVHSALLTDHDRLQTLHDMLTSDYDRAKYDNSQLKLRLKNHKSTTEEVTMLRCENDREKRHGEELKAVIADEKDRFEIATRTLQNDITSLRIDCDHMRQDNTNLRRKNEAQADDLRRLHISDQSSRTAVARLSANIEQLNKSLQARDLQIAKLQNKIDMLNHLNRTLEEENKMLVRQMDHLLAQNKDLLAKALNDKDNYHAEQKEFQEKLAALRRHKEKLEEKIMEQYRMMDNSKKCTKEKQTLVKRAAKALISKSPKKVNNNNNSTINDKQCPNCESTAEDSSIYSTDAEHLQSLNHQSNDRAYRHQIPSSPLSATIHQHHSTANSSDGQYNKSSTSLPYQHNSHSNRPLLVNTQPSATVPFPRNSSVRMSAVEKRSSSFPVRFASFRARPRSTSTSNAHKTSNVNPGYPLERQPSTYDNLNNRINP